MGELLRRYWHPIAGVAELDRRPVREVRVLRCSYHGWLFDETGRCLHQPFEERAHPHARFREKVAINAYPVRELAGLLWAYLGPEPAPLLPDWDRFHHRGY